MANPIGGYFELELPRYQEYHAGAIALNSGRFCLEYILRCKKIKKVYVPFYTCDSVVQPIENLDISYQFYHIDTKYQITDDIHLLDGDVLLYTNYWGLLDSYCRELANKYKNQLILDYTQAFYSLPIEGIDTFYSCRKYFGVPDGAYLYTDAKADFDIEQDKSYNCLSALVKRIDLSAEAGYEDFHANDRKFHESPLRGMSKFTRRMMQGIDYEGIAQRRRRNYTYLQHCLGGRQLQKGEVPMVFPYISDMGQELRKKLIAGKVFVAKYWPNVEEWARPDATETWLSNHLLPLPIDQRYEEKEMERIIKIIKE